MKLNEAISQYSDFDLSLSLLRDSEVWHFHNVYYYS